METLPALEPPAEAFAQRLAVLLADRLRRSTHTDVILTREEARAYVKRRSDAAFCTWCRRWRIKPRSRGRYSRFALDRALELEAGPRPHGAPNVQTP